MDKVNELYEQMKAFWAEFDENHTTFSTKGTKAAAGRSRKAIQSLKKIVTDYKKASMEAVKAGK